MNCFSFLDNAYSVNKHPGSVTEKPNADITFLLNCKCNPFLPKSITFHFVYDTDEHMEKGINTHKQLIEMKLPKICELFNCADYLK